MVVSDLYKLPVSLVHPCSCTNSYVWEKTHRVRECMQAIACSSIYNMHHKRWKVLGKCIYHFGAVNIFPSHIASPFPNVLIMFYSDCKNSAYLNIFISSKTTAGRRQRFHFNPLLALLNVKCLCSAFSKSIGTMNISKWISDHPEQNIKHVLCFSKTTFKNRTSNKASWKFMKTDNSPCILFPFVWKPVLLKQFKEKQNCDSSAKQTTPSLCVNKLTSHQILMSKLIPPNLLFTFLRLCPGYRSAMVAMNFASTGSFLGSTVSNQLSLGSDNSLTILLFGLLAVWLF